jgi:6-pyruvoyltetrahydropterin/6-carboxytetrahydropterin synthase
LYEITDEVEVAAAHRLRDMQGEGERLHGHTWRVRATVGAARLDARGLVLDFADLRAALCDVTRPFESRCLNEVAPFDRELNPTAENLARFFAEALERRIGDDRVRVRRVEVWETPTCVAIYTPG